MRRVTAPLVLFASLAACAPGEECVIAPGLDEEQCAALDNHLLPEELPPARGNAFGDDEGAAALGFTWFYDARFSSNLEVRCASCHMPEHSFGDLEKTSTAGIGDVPRNSPSILNAPWQRWQFWDGRADSLWSQPQFALQAPNEMGYSRLEIAHRVADSFADEYVPVFGELPPLSDDARFPAVGGPGAAAFDDMDEADRYAVDEVVANVGKALEAYLRKTSSGRSRFDRALLGETAALSDVEKEGLRVLVQAGCTECHSGSLFGGVSFHRIGVGDGSDRGRAQGAATLADSTFALFGEHADADALPDDAPDRDALLAEADDPAMEGAFIAPPLRNVTQRDARAALRARRQLRDAARDRGVPSRRRRGRRRPAAGARVAHPRGGRRAARVPRGARRRLPAAALEQLARSVAAPREWSSRLHVVGTRTSTTGAEDPPEVR
jgi:cytochrome c peroxidase